MVALVVARSERSMLYFSFDFINPGVRAVHGILNIQFLISEQEDDFIFIFNFYFFYFFSLIKQGHRERGK